MLYQCDVFDQGMHLPLLLCGECRKRLRKQGAQMRCMSVANDELSCSQCTKPSAGTAYYEQRRRIVL